MTHAVAFILMQTVNIALNNMYSHLSIRRLDLGTMQLDSNHSIDFIALLSHMFNYCAMWTIHWF